MPAVPRPANAIGTRETKSTALQALPTPIVDIAFQAPSDQTWDSSFQPHLPQQRIVPLLIQEQLVMASERWVHLTVLIEVRSDGPGAMLVVEEEHHAFSNVDEETNVTTASE